MTTIEVTDDEVWMLYDLVATQKQQHDDAETVTRSNCGGERWRLLHRKLQKVLPPVEAPQA